MSESKREVQAIDYAVCEIMAVLDNLFFQKVEGWQLNRTGLNFEVSPGKLELERVVRIRPIGWPDSSLVHCRLEKSGEFGWIAFEGSVQALHIGFYFQFKAEWNFSWGINIIPLGAREEEILARIRESESGPH